MKLHGLKNCDTCRKAMKAIEAAGKKVAFHDVRADGVSKAQVARWAKAVGWETLLNTRSTTWRELPASKKEGVDQNQAICLMADHPTLMKRPIIERGATQVFVGWTKAVQDEVL